MEHGRLKIAVLVSGSGSNLQAILDAAEGRELPARVVVVASDNPAAYGLVRAKERAIPTYVVDYSKGPGEEPDPLPFDLEALLKEQRLFSGLAQGELQRRIIRLALLEEELLKSLEPHGPDIVVLAGFMRLLTPHFLNAYPMRVINIHPALLPSFPGTDGYGDTFRYGCSFGGITVHFVDPGEDTGPIIAQLTYPIYPDDTLEQVKGRGLGLEHKLFPAVLRWYAQGHVKIEETARGRPRVKITAPDYSDFVRSAVVSSLR